MLLVLWYGALQVADGNLSAGLLTSFMLYTLTIAMGAPPARLLGLHRPQHLHSSRRCMASL